MKSYTAFEVREMLKSACAGYGGQTAFAKKAKCSLSFVNDTLHGHREPSGCVLNMLGLQRQVRYVKKTNGKQAATIDAELGRKDGQA
jgi:hypothetical protein